MAKTYKCRRCGKKLNEKKCMIQYITYLGNMSERFDICSECMDSFRDWFEEFQDCEE